MRSFVICIPGHKESIEVANRCIASGAKFNQEIKPFFGITPKDNPLQLLLNNGIPQGGFVEKYSFVEKAAAAFLSHYTLWQSCVSTGEETVIFEHDAVLIDPIPTTESYKGLLTFGKPSYGKYNTPIYVGVNPLTSKRYLPGAHAYKIKPQAAKALINMATYCACPTDIYLNVGTFPWIEEYYPWAAIADDSFSTIQREAGCLAKHNYKPGYKLL